MTATKQTHSPGPWTYSADDKLNRDRAFGINRDIDMGDGPFTETIAEVCGGCANAEADARLIAAAPDLLAACEAVQADIESYIRGEWADVDRWNTLAKLLAAAIAKARGEA